MVEIYLQKFARHTEVPCRKRCGRKIWKLLIVQVGQFASLFWQRRQVECQSKPCRLGDLSTCQFETDLRAFIENRYCIKILYI